MNHMYKLRELSWDDPTLVNPSGFVEGSDEYHLRVKYVAEFREGIKNASMLYLIHVFVWGRISYFSPEHWDPLWLMLKDLPNWCHLKEGMLPIYPSLFEPVWEMPPYNSLRFWLVLSGVLSDVQ